jgi:hypothetical protein
MDDRLDGLNQPKVVGGGSGEHDARDINPLTINH